MAKENFFIKMEIYSKENLKKIKRMEKEFIISVMEQNWQDNSKKEKRKENLNYITKMDLLKQPFTNKLFFNIFFYLIFIVNKK